MTAIELSTATPHAIDLDNFRVNLADFPYGFWKRLGEAKSKCLHILRAPLLPSVRMEISQVYLVRGVHSTTAIEGNTLTEEEVMAIFRRELTLPPSRLYQGVEVVNIIGAMNDAWARPLAGNISEQEILGMNQRVLEGLEVADWVTPGAYRQTGVHAGPYVPPPWNYVTRFMGRFVEWYNDFPRELEDLDVISMAIIKAIAAHLYFVLIHPFGDGNGRTARLIEWRTLDHGGIASATSHLLSNHYNLTRTRYYQMLDAASRGGDIKPFFCYALEGLVDQLIAQLDLVHKQYDELVYISMVRDRTPGRDHAVVERRQELAIAICRAQSPVPAGNLGSLNPVVAAYYRLTSERVLARDLSALEDANLIANTPQGWLAVKDQMYYQHARDRGAALQG